VNFQPSTPGIPPFGKGGPGGIPVGVSKSRPGEIPHRPPFPTGGTGSQTVWSWMAAALLCILPCHPLPAQADTTWDAALYAYPEIRSLTGDSVLNPGNRIARLPDNMLTGEARLNLRAESDGFRLALRPILSIRHETGEDDRDAYLAQWQARATLADTWAASLGREVMNWGPAQFRSPSSPFYFDNGRANPLRELSGVDAAKLAWTPDRRFSLSLSRVTGSGHDAPPSDPWRHTWLAKADLRGDDWAGGLALAKPDGRGLFAGVHLQHTLDDAWLVYGELSSSTRADALRSPADAAQPFTVAAESPRRATGLVGATLTLESGHSLTLEYLHDGHGFSRAGSRAYFARAAAGPPSAGMALAGAPPLLNRGYLHLVWQNNLLEGDDYWRLMLSRNLDDGGNELAGYGEHAINGRLSLFALAVLNTGGPRREFASLIERGLTLGLRLALP